MNLVRSICIVLACASGTASAQNDQQAPAEVTPSEAHAWVALFDKVVDTVVVHRTDCAKMVSGLDAVIDANQGTIAMARDARAKGKRLPAAAQQQMLDGARKMVAALDKCGRDEKVAASFKRLNLSGH